MANQNNPSPADQQRVAAQLEFQKRVNKLVQRIHEAENFYDIFPLLERDMLELLGAERITVYRRSRRGEELISKYKSGDEIQEIRVPLSTTSVAGYVGLTQKALLIRDVYNTRELTAIHPNLRFDASFDRQSGFRSRDMVVVPVRAGAVMLGVIQLLNRHGGGVFNVNDLKNAEKLAGLIGQKFRYDLGGTASPFAYLVHNGRITQEEIAEYEREAAAAGVPVSRLLINKAGLGVGEIGKSLERYHQVPFMEFDPELEPPEELMAEINPAYFRRELWLPVAGDRDEVTILIDDPSDTARIMEIQRVLRANNYNFRVGLPDDILRFIGEEVEVGPEDSADLDALVTNLDTEAEAREQGVDALAEEQMEPGIIRLVNKLILEASRLGASDIHIQCRKPPEPAVVRLRVDGVCRDALDIPHNHIGAVVARIKVMSGLDIAERRKPQDGKIAVRLRDKPIELRVATLPTVHGEDAVLRILAASKPLPMEKLNFSERNLREVQSLISHPHGIFLVVGPTGSGKTTTLHSVLGHINTPEKMIWTAEDPVEITQAGLRQMQMLPKIGLNFAAALRAFLRADPDVIMIGEMRDQETCQAGLEAALTGHLVFSTLHTNSASETVTRLLDMGMDPISFADALLGVLAQRLMRTLCAECKEAYTPSEQEFHTIAHLFGEAQFHQLKLNREAMRLHRAVGCDACGGTGYRGRTGIHELLTNTPAMKELIYHRAPVAEILTLSMREGMRTLMQDGIVKVLKGQTDMEQLRRVVAE